jgi:hypothetical protein
LCPRFGGRQQHGCQGRGQQDALASYFNVHDRSPVLIDFDLRVTIHFKPKAASAQTVGSGIRPYGW